MMRKSTRSPVVCWRLGTFLVALAAVVVSAGPAAGAASAVVVSAAPTWPIPTDAPAGPPPIQALTAADATPPPAGQIADPVTPAATCGGWFLQSYYGNRWPAAPSWWEYQCTSEADSGYNNCGGGACNASCDYCYVETERHTDHFYSNGSDAVFFGQDYYYYLSYWGNLLGDGGSEVSAWWDAPTAKWYNLEPVSLTVSKQGNGSGAVDSNPASISCGDACQASFNPDTVVTLTATPDASSAFTGWSGDCSGTGTCQIMMDQARAVTATFARNTVDLTVSKTGTGSGSVTSTPAGIGCGYSCQASFGSGTVVTLTATPDASSTFTGWSGDCSGTGTCQITMDQARGVTATFARNTVDLTVSKTGTGSGAVTSTPAGIGCGNGCQASFGTGTVVTLTATPDAGSVFAGWSGDCSGTGTCQLTMSQARSVTATFAPNMPPHASFTLSCTSLACNFDASASGDPDNGIASFAWNFGDGTSGSGSKPPTHTYPKPGSYTVTLTVSDKAGATGTTSKAFNPISVSARGYRQNGAQRVDLSWNGASGTSFDIYRNGSRVATVQAFSYTDTVTGKGSFSYKVCAAANSVCSNTASLTF
jgi:PKD repeat protein